MTKAMRKPHPSMPHWWWLGMDGCWFCNNRNNCNQCKTARASGKSKWKKWKVERRRDKQQKERMNDDYT